MSYVNSFPEITFAESYNPQETFCDSIYMYTEETRSVRSPTRHEILPESTRWPYHNGLRSSFSDVWQIHHNFTYKQLRLEASEM